MVRKHSSRMDFEIEKREVRTMLAEKVVCQQANMRPATVDQIGPQMVDLSDKIMARTIKKNDVTRELFFRRMMDLTLTNLDSGTNPLSRFVIRVEP